MCAKYCSTCNDWHRQQHMTPVLHELHGCLSSIGSSTNSCCSCIRTLPPSPGTRETYCQPTPLAIACTSPNKQNLLTVSLHQPHDAFSVAVKMLWNALPEGFRHENANAVAHSDNSKDLLSPWYFMVRRNKHYEEVTHSFGSFLDYFFYIHF